MAPFPAWVSSREFISFVQIDNDKEGGNVNWTPILHDLNYDYWKSNMISFIKSMGNKTWKTIIKGWTHPVVTTKDGTRSPKSKAYWSKDKDEESHGNSRALNSILNGVDKNVFLLINLFTEDKEAWEILKTAHEGASKVSMSRLQLLTTKFKNMKTKEDETITNVYVCVCDITNNSFSLCEQMYGEKLAKKILRSFPNKFDMKLSTIEEAQYISLIKVYELISSLLTFEMDINKKTKKKRKGLDYKVGVEDDKEQDIEDTDKNMSNSIGIQCEGFR